MTYSTSLETGLRMCIKYVFDDIRSMVYKGHRQIATIAVPYKKCRFMLCQKAIGPYWLSLIKVFLIKHIARLSWPNVFF